MRRNGWARGSHWCTAVGEIEILHSSVAGGAEVESHRKGLKRRDFIRPKRLSSILSGSTEFVGTDLGI